MSMFIFIAIYRLSPARLHHPTTNKSQAGRARGEGHPSQPVGRVSCPNTLWPLGQRAVDHLVPRHCNVAAVDDLGEREARVVDRVDERQRARLPVAVRVHVEVAVVVEDEVATHHDGHDIDEAPDAGQDPAAPQVPRFPNVAADVVHERVLHRDGKREPKRHEHVPVELGQVRRERQVLRHDELQRDQGQHNRQRDRHAWLQLLDGEEERDERHDDEQQDGDADVVDEER
mmetsp:Transcript_29008/g.63087  ORF Transcript_29008/g.63087 Transcript_29008/m.63087 type:complete len:230 (+) Transcript_29008:458-1147(+)